MKAYDRIHDKAASYHLKLRVDKCQVFIPTALIEGGHEHMSAENDSNSTAVSQSTHHHNIINACKQRQLRHDDKMEVLGVMMGSNNVVEQECDDTVASQSSLFKHLMHPSMPVQVASLLLRVCGLPRLSYMARTIHPTLVKNAAEQFDRDALQCFNTIFQCTDATRPNEGEAKLSQEQVEMQISLPISMGGMGMRPTSRILHAAYFSSLAAIMPDFLRLFPQCTNYEQTTIHHELIECRQELFRQGVGKSKSKQTQKGKRMSMDKNNTAVTPKKPNENNRALSSSINPKIMTTPVKSSRTVSIPSSSTPRRNTTETDDTTNTTGSTTLHSSMKQLWQRAKQHSIKQGKTNTPMLDHDTFLNPQKLQHDITAQIEDSLYKKLFHSSTERHQVVLTSLQTRGCNTYLTVLPTPYVIYCQQRVELHGQRTLASHDPDRMSTGCHRLLKLGIRSPSSRGPISLCIVQDCMWLVI